MRGSFIRKSSLIAMIIVLAALVGCSNGPSKPTPVAEKADITVLVVDQGSSAAGQKVNDLIDKSKKYVEENNEGLTVNVIKASPDQYLKQIETLHPDVYWIVSSEFERLSKQNKLYDLTPLLEAEGLNIGDYYPPNLVDLTTFDGKLLAVTLAAVNMTVGYSKDWFDAANIDYPQEDWTWEQFADIAAKLKQANGADSSVMYGAAVPMFPEFVETLVMSKGGSYLSADGQQASGYWDGEPVVDTIKGSRNC
jgi:multiple sugar transport system substrate-binding protein